MQADISQSLTSLVIASNNFAKDKLKLNQLPETLGENLSEMNQMLTELESQADKYSEVEGLGLTDGQQDVVDNIRSKYSELKQTLKTHDELAVSLGSAKSHQALFSALEKIVGSGLTESKHYKAAEAILPSSSFFENLEGKTFMPGAPGSWGSAIDSISRSLRPRELVAEEKSLLDQLYDEARIKSVFATRLFSAPNSEKFLKTGEAWQPAAKNSSSGIRWTSGQIFPQKLVFLAALVQVAINWTRRTSSVKVK